MKTKFNLKLTQIPEPPKAPPLRVIEERLFCKKTKSCESNTCELCGKLISSKTKARKICDNCFSKFVYYVNISKRR